MAKTVRVLKGFNGINKDQDSPEKTRYFMRENEDTAEAFLSDDEFAYRVEKGFLSVEETPDLNQPLVFKSPDEESAASSSSTRRRRGSPASE
jgi:hypothetical protein